MLIDDLAGKTTAKPVIHWPGGKTRMLKLLLPMIPPHNLYCEPFAGGLAMLMRKARSPIEVVNDINGDLVALYRCIQYHLPELTREISHMISSRQTLYDFLNNPGLTDIQRAARFYYRHRCSFAGKGKTFAVAKTRASHGFEQQINRDLLGAARTRLDGVIVEHATYDHCFRLYDSPETFWFLDPPYLHARPDAYDGWTESELETFRARVAKLKGLWIVTLDDSPFNRKLWSGCQVEAVTTRNGCCNTANGIQRFGELIIRPPQAA
jgi:DNA adenine methylase